MNNMIDHTISRGPKPSLQLWRDAGFSMMTALLTFGMAATQIRADEATDARPQEEAGQQMTITGRLLGPDDKPVAGGQVAVVVSHKRRSERPSGTFFATAGLASAPKLLGTAKTDQAGQC